MTIYYSTIKRLRQLLIVSVPVLLAGCQHSPEKQGQSMYANACNNNAYLARYDCSLERIQRAAEEGSADAQYALGYMYYYGISTTRDQETAELWIKRSAAQGQPLAKKALSLIRNGSHFSDLHHAASGGATHRRRSGGGGGTSLYQPPTDVETLNTSAPEKPIHDVLPNYNASGTKKKAPVLDVLKKDTAQEAKNVTTTTTNTPPPLTDPRLSSHAKPVVPKHVQKHGDGYTIQLMASHHLPSLKAYAKKEGLSKEARYYKTQVHKKSWYVLTYGHFKSKSQASSAVRQLPKQAKASHPWVKSMKSLKNDQYLNA